MTWIKPSFFWMMYRSGWASKPNQERILSITMSRTGFDWALAHACLSHFDPDVHESYDLWRNQLRDFPVRIQWDPERNAHLQPVPYKRAIQIGLAKEAVDKYKQDWIIQIDDITDYCVALKENIKSNESFTESGDEILLPCNQKIYPTPYDVACRLNIGI